MRGATAFGAADCSSIYIFQSTLPMRGATSSRHQGPNRERISIHTPHAGSDNPKRDQNRQHGVISIHTPHAGSDTRCLSGARSGQMISIHTPHAGSDNTAITWMLIDWISIHTPHAGSDLSCPVSVPPDIDFNPHSPCGERPLLERRTIGADDFNPHSPCGERLTGTYEGADTRLFQSTLPMRGATCTGWPVLG